MPNGYKRLVEYKDTYLKPSKEGDELIWGINLGDKLKNPNETFFRDRNLEKKLEKQKREEMRVLREGVAAALEASTEEARAVADEATKRLLGK